MSLGLRGVMVADALDILFVGVRSVSEVTVAATEELVMLFELIIVLLEGVVHDAFGVSASNFFSGAS